MLYFLWIAVKTIFDNYCTLILLIFCLEKREIQTLGTVIHNLIVSCPPSDDKNVIKKQRGYSGEFFTKLSYLKLIVTVLSIFSPNAPILSVNHFNRQRKKHADVSCPNIFLRYNKHMRGVHALDFNTWPILCNFILMPGWFKKSCKEILTISHFRV